MCLGIHHEILTADNKTFDESALNVQAQTNGTVADQNTLLLEFASDVPSSENLLNAETPSPNDPLKQFTNI